MQLRIRRKGYTRKDGVRVKASTFKIKDRGHKGRTPKSRQFFHPNVHTGWRKYMAAQVRRCLVLKAHKGDYLASARSMQALANTTTDKITMQLARADARYL